MTDSNDRAGDRIAKVIARAGLASRRDAEQMVADLRVSVNGKAVSNVATNIVAGDKVAVDGVPLPKADGARLWLYHKPAGLVTTEKDEKDRETVFETLPEELGRVLSVGRLDLNSEGLLLLTNDGELKRQLELPSTGWLRRYRVRVNGKPNDESIKKLADGITVEGDDGPETFAPMQITFDRQQGANAWLTVGLREGRNREIRRAFSAVDMYVNRLIRVSYGPFQLGALEVGGIEEIKPRILKEQLGETFSGELAESRKEMPVAEEPRRDDRPARKPRTGSPAEARVARAAQPERPHTGKPPYTRNDGDGSRPPRGARPARDGDSPRKFGDKPNRDGTGPRKFGAKPVRDGDGPRKFAGKPPRDGDKPRRDGDKRPPRKQWDGNPDRPSRDGDRAPWSKGGDIRDGDRPQRSGKPGGKPRFDDRPKETKSERTERMRNDTSISIRKGGQRGRGVAKPKKAPSTKRMKKPGDAED